MSWYLRVVLTSITLGGNFVISATWIPKLRSQTPEWIGLNLQFDLLENCIIRNFYNFFRQICNLFSTVAKNKFLHSVMWGDELHLESQDTRWCWLSISHSQCSMTQDQSLMIDWRLPGQRPPDSSHINCFQDPCDFIIANKLKLKGFLYTNVAMLANTCGANIYDCAVVNTFLYFPISTRKKLSTNWTLKYRSKTCKIL